ncbi:hypothetical protein ACFSUK_08190 [Sphingobium scionense]
MRVAPMGGVFGLDYGAALALGSALSADMELLAEILPDVDPRWFGVRMAMAAMMRMGRR